MIKTLTLAALVLSPLTAAAAGCKPQVDLGYAIHESTSYNETNGIYQWSNIRYGQSPTGNMRWKPPATPTGRDPRVQNGTQPRVCPQTTVSWIAADGLYIRDYLTGKSAGFDWEKAKEQTKDQVEQGVQAAYNTPGVTEDCLFLDVRVPRRVFEAKSKKKVPVFVWIHGGGYIWGYKHSPTEAMSPEGLLEFAMKQGDDFIAVNINYRLGAFGFLNGPSFQGNDGTANVGLLDQKLALEWVQDKIHLFGGDKDQVTIGGVSAGGGSGVHHLTAHGGRDTPPFKRMFATSPGYAPVNSNYRTEKITQDFLGRLNVTTIDEARKLPSEALIKANMEQVLAPDRDFTYWPSVDGSYVPQLPSISLLAGNFKKDVDIMMGYEALEGGVFAAPFVHTKDDFKAFIRSLLYSVTDAELDVMVNKLYPGKLPETTMDLYGDLGIKCNTNWVSQAYGNKTWQYLFEVPPALHGTDMPYILRGPDSRAIGNTTIPKIADYMQGYLTNFITKGNPNGRGLPDFPQQGHELLRSHVTKDGIVVKPDDLEHNDKCRYWQKGLFA